MIDGAHPSDDPAVTHRSGRARRLALLAIGVVLLGAATTYMMVSNMSAMSCQTFDEPEFQSTSRAEAAEPRYRPPADGKNAWSAQFEFAHFARSGGHGLQLIVASDAAGGVIYDGPLKSSLSLLADRGLLVRDGRDAFRIVLVEPKARRICVAEHSGPFWQDGKIVTIELLATRQNDAAGLPVAFAVTSRPR